MPEATNMASATIKFCPVVVNLIMFIEKKHRSRRYPISSKLKKKKLEETLVFVLVGNQIDAHFLL